MKDDMKSLMAELRSLVARIESSMGDDESMEEVETDESEPDMEEGVEADGGATFKRKPSIVDDGGSVESEGEDDGFSGRKGMMVAMLKKMRTK